MYSLGRLDEAREIFTRALRNGPASGRLLNGLALTFEAIEAMHNLAEAERFYREAIAAGEKGAIADYGQFLLKTGRNSDSIRLLREGGAVEQLARVEKGRHDSPAAAHARCEGNGKFRESAMEAGVAYDYNGKAVSAMGVDFHDYDYDNDGREDLFVTTLSNESFLLFRNMGNRFSNMTAPSQVGIANMSWTGWINGMFDLNNNGFKDIVVAAGHVMDNAELTTSRKSPQPTLVFTNRGDATFKAATPPGEAFHRAAAFGYVDRDGRIDVVVTRLNDKQLQLRNVSPGSQHWISLEPVGTHSNRDAIAVRVHLVTGDGEQWNRVTTTAGYGSANEHPVQFGLGNCPSVNSIEIEWPSGNRQHLSNVTADRYSRRSE